MGPLKLDENTTFSELTKKIILKTKHNSQMKKLTDVLEVSDQRLYNLDISGPRQAAAKLAMQMKWHHVMDRKGNFSFYYNTSCFIDEFSTHMLRNRIFSKRIMSVQMDNLKQKMAEVLQDYIKNLREKKKKEGKDSYLECLNQVSYYAGLWERYYCIEDRSKFIMTCLYRRDYEQAIGLFDKVCQMCYDFKIPLEAVGAPHSLVKAVDKMQDFDDSVKNGACRLSISCLKLYHRFEQQMKKISKVLEEDLEKISHNPSLYDYEAETSRFQVEACYGSISRLLKTASQLTLHEVYIKLEGVIVAVGKAIDSKKTGEFDGLLEEFEDTLAGYEHILSEHKLPNFFLGFLIYFKKWLQKQVAPCDQGVKQADESDVKLIKFKAKFEKMFMRYWDYTFKYLKQFPSEMDSEYNFDSIKQTAEFVQCLNLKAVEEKKDEFFNGLCFYNEKILCYIGDYEDGRTSTGDKLDFLGAVDSMCHTLIELYRDNKYLFQFCHVPNHLYALVAHISEVTNPHRLGNLPEEIISTLQSIRACATFFKKNLPDYFEVATGLCNKTYIADAICDECPSELLRQPGNVGEFTDCMAECNKIFSKKLEGGKVDLDKTSQRGRVYLRNIFD